MIEFSAATRVMTLAVIAATGLAITTLAVTSADAAPAKRRSTVVYSNGPNYSYQSGPRTRIYVSKRSWLDGGTEVLPGDRKFSDYAFPPAVGYPSFARENLNRPIDRQPLMAPSDLGGYPTRIPIPY
ncbi:hypothetical protein HL667_22955 [Bradyrhizobium sp. 83012]|uniref:Uncharacterized protein n=1 Tax=Bradyrhizobium aeschynomenes TaxID=2734909 RepID=A0ABX2CI37_9BRAD|nr:hypothetical protein [Bradyrhizobium aeschynomenes]NPU14178.1 hypothetical protein [Bradyrhizobium aeschynomenes]NPU67881.1 hypothetical protein [Bradyrhizobium aeschynomenes]NPV24043.1 hypothetical protein [Bradyrhizobium aeschynomenes]